MSVQGEAVRKEHKTAFVANPTAEHLNVTQLGPAPVSSAPTARPTLTAGGHAPVPAARVLRMQQLHGNSAVSRMIQVSRFPAPQPRIAGIATRASEAAPPDFEVAPAAELNSIPRSSVPPLGGAVPPAPPSTHIRRSPAGGTPQIQRSAGDAILDQIASAARNIPGYGLLTVALGRDPITGLAVDRSATNLIRGVLSLAPGGLAMFDNLQQSGAIDRAFAWFNDEIAKLGLNYGSIRATFQRALDSLSALDVLDPMGAIQRLIGLFTPILGRLRTFAVDAGRKVLEFIFEGVMSRAGSLGQQVLGIIRQAGDVFTTIMRDPVGFVGNLIRAVGQGFRQFAGNIMTHLREGLMGWLFGTLAQTGLHLPERFDLSGIVSLVLQILGLTYNRFRAILVRLMGERPVAALERTFDFLRTLVTRGLGAAWQKILEFASGLVDTAIGAIRDWVAESVVGAAITRLLSMFNPAGAVIQAIIAIYNTIQFFIERAQQIASVANAVFQSIGRIAAGDVSGAANFVEQTMARAVPVVLGFLSRLLGLGNIADRIRAVIQRVQGVVEQALTRVGNWIASRARGLLGRLRGGDQAAAQQATPQQRERQLANAMQHVQGLITNGTPAPALRGMLPRIKQQFGLASLTMNEAAPQNGRENVTIEGLAQRTVLTGSVPTGGTSSDPGVSAPGLGRIGLHGSKPPSLRNGPKVHWLESEHVIPFAVGKQLWDTVKLIVPGRGGGEDRGQTTIMIYYGAARIKTPDDNRLSAAFEAAVQRADIRNRLTAARQRRAIGTGAEAGQVARDLLGLLMQGLRVAKEDAVARTNAAIVAENNAKDDGNPLTNGQRRAPTGSSEPPSPDPSAVSQAAETQYDNVVGLVESAVSSAG